MFTLLSGPFHPHLESKLVETVQRIKAADPRVPFAIVVPSESLRRRLQWVLCVEHGYALFDVHFLTFHQLALRVYAEYRTVSLPDIPPPSLELVGDVFYEYLLSTVMHDSSSSHPFVGHTGSSGFSAALWRTIQDLREAQVDPDVVLRGLQEGLFEESATERLEGVFALQAKIQEWSTKLGVGLPDDLTQMVIPWVAQSPFIARLSSVLYYGFYDTTQVQLSLLEEMARATNVTVFFPLFQGDGSQFAQRFLDRYLLKAGVVHQSLNNDAPVSLDESGRMWNPHIHVVNAVGPEGELTFTCKAILKQTEEMGVAWNEIGVVARNLEPYLSYFPRTFKAHRIPFGTTATRLLLEEPLAKVWWGLAGLQEESFGWRSMLDMVTSPWYRYPVDPDPKVRLDSHVWVQAVHHFRIVGGKDDWERLVFNARDVSAIQQWAASNNASADWAENSLQTIAEIVGVLMKDCQRLPAAGSMSALTQAYTHLLEKHFWFPHDHPVFSEDEASIERNECLMHGFEQVMEALHQLDRIGQEVTWTQWLAVFRSLLERTTLPVLGQTSMGVQILDVMASRGRPYHTLFILGLNDHVFPRVVREDAFLRDRDRQVLAESLGYKIDEKMVGFDEEALLFSLLRQSARHDAYLLYQRADEQGRPLIPSSLLRAQLECAELEPIVSEHRFPVGIRERFYDSWVSSKYGTPQEIQLCAVLDGQPIQTITSFDFPWRKVFQNGIKVLSQLERSGSKAGPFDGMTGESSSYWEELVARGLSPTALGTYAQCPMRYWMNHVLNISEIPDDLSHELSGRVWGELVHSVLCRVYQALTQQGWPQQAIGSPVLEDIVRFRVGQILEEYAKKFGKGYFLIWKWMSSRLLRMVLLLIEWDQRDFLEQGWVPSQFEVEATGSFQWKEDTPSDLLPLRGRFDRVDRTGEPGCVRIVDYKVSMRRTVQSDEGDLLTKALQGRELQPALYSHMTPTFHQGGVNNGEMPEGPMHSVIFRYLRPMQAESVRSASFSGTIWKTATGKQLRGTLHRWVEGIREGKFFIMPGNHCGYCPYASACRFQHHPTWLRAYRWPLAKTFRSLRKQKVSDG